MELLTGATGYIGGRLLERLTDEGRAVRILSRDPSRLQTPPGVEAVRADVIEGKNLAKALDGCETAYYLVHSMEHGAVNGAFANRDRRAADNFARAAQEA